uniref:Uncharacterized protein n=1 Tax=Arundo donax TaxID=35708 RepID=A0A0A9QRG8_ARUDO
MCYHNSFIPQQHPRISAAVSTSHLTSLLIHRHNLSICLCKGLCRKVMSISWMLL